MAQALSAGEHRVGALVSKINEHHLEASQHFRQVVLSAVKAGNFLAEVKSIVRHGTFEACLQERCPNLPMRTAQVYMQLAAGWPEIVQKLGPEAASSLSIQGAIRLVYQPPDRGDKRSSLRNSPQPGESSDEPSPICPRGGSHEWEEDQEDGQEYCAKCHDPRAGHVRPRVDGKHIRESEVGIHTDNAPHGQAEIRHKPAPGIGKPVEAAVPTPSSNFDCVINLLQAAIRTVDQCQKESPHDKLHGDVVQSLKIAYDDFVLWKKANRK